MMKVIVGKNKKMEREFVTDPPWDWQGRDLVAEPSCDAQICARVGARRGNFVSSRGKTAINDFQVEICFSKVGTHLNL